MVRFVIEMDALTIHEAAEVTGWSPRMLRYIERLGLVQPRRSSSGYRLYGPAELQRLGTLKELLGRHQVGLSEIGFAFRLRQDGELSNAVERWLSSKAKKPAHVPASGWLAFEQEKHQRLLPII